MDMTTVQTLHEFALLSDSLALVLFPERSDFLRV